MTDRPIRPPSAGTGPRPARRPPRGVVLVVVLVLLLCSMLLAAASFEMATLDERKAGNTRDRQVAFQAAESALRDAETLLRSDTDGPFQPLRVREFTAQCSNALCRSTEAAPVWSQLSEADWTGSKTLALGAGTGAQALTGVAAQPRYVVEYQGTAQPIEPGKPCVAMFLITARAQGAAATTNVMLQSVLRLRIGECYAAV